VSLRKAKIALIIVLVMLLVSISFDGGEYMAPSVPMLDLNSEGPDVSDMQQRLKNWGYYKGNIDGFFGWDTFFAVREFQESHGLEPTGIADPKTLMAMGFTKLRRPRTVYAQSAKGISEEQLLARAINGEARGEPYEGQVAVGAVILNRTRDPKFPKTIAGVIYQPGAFTAVSDGQINVPIDSNSTVVKAARDALNGWDPTDGCLYYWNPATATSKWIWSRTIVKKIGKHYFGK